MLSCNLSPIYHHSLSLSLSALSYAPLGTRRRDDTKENGVKTLPNCCYCFCFVLCCFSLIFASKTFCPTGTGRGREREREADSTALPLIIYIFVRFFINSTPLSLLLLLLLSFSPCTFCIFVYHTACLSLMRRLSCVFASVCVPRCVFVCVCVRVCE